MEVAYFSSITRAVLGVLFICSVVAQNAAAVSQPRVELIPRVLVPSQSSGEGSLVKLVCQSRSHDALQEPHLTRWYKIVDGEQLEFYQYELTRDPQKQYPVDVPFTNVDEDESDGYEVGLYNVNESTSGLYMCTQQMGAGPDDIIVVRRYRLTVEAPSNVPLLNIHVNTELASWVSLSCDLTERFNRTYAYQWFVNETEIYSYVPWNLEQPERAFPVPHVSVNLQQSNGSHIILDNLETESLGYYKCFAYVTAPRTASHVHRITLTT